MSYSYDFEETSTQKGAWEYALDLVSLGYINDALSETIAYSTMRQGASANHLSIFVRTHEVVMKHLNLIPAHFTEKGHWHSSRRNRPRLMVQPWSFFVDMSWYGHDFGKYFVVQVPRQIVPGIIQGETGLVRVLPFNSFNVVLDENQRMKIVPAVQQQEGVLIFGQVACGKNRFEIVEGQELILYSEENDFYSNHRVLFAAVVSSSQRIVIRTNVWIDSKNPKDWGSKDIAHMFDVNGKSSIPWKEYCRKSKLPKAHDQDAQIVEDETYFNGRTGRKFKSNLAVFVLGRPKSKLDADWQELGWAMKGVYIPPDYEVGIRFYGTRLVSTLIQQLVDFGPIQMLHLEGTTDDGLTNLKAIDGLTSLNLEECEQITDAGLAHLEVITGLTSLNLARCHKITDEGLTHLKPLTNLIALDLSGKPFSDSVVQIADTGLAQLKNLTNLKSLNLAWNTQITDAGLAHLRTLTSLTTLNLERCEQITDAGLAHLRTFTSLTTLNLGGCKQITDAGLMHLKTLTSLSSLSLFGGEQITDAGLALLKALVNLTNLRLFLIDSCPVTDAGLKSLSRPGLEMDIEFAVF